MNSTQWWQHWYMTGHGSGDGSVGELAAHKADVMNGLIQGSVLELGCGDGEQIKLIDYDDYIGYDVSPTAVRICRLKHPDLTFVKELGDLRADMTVSLDVAYHLVEDDVFAEHITDLFDRARKRVVIYSTVDDSRDIEGHIKHREMPEGHWPVVPNPIDEGGAVFYVYGL